MTNKTIGGVNSLGNKVSNLLKYEQVTESSIWKYAYVFIIFSILMEYYFNIPLYYNIGKYAPLS